MEIEVDTYEKNAEFEKIFQTTKFLDFILTYYIEKISEEFQQYLNEEEDKTSIEEISEEMKKQMYILEMEGVP